VTLKKKKLSYRCKSND